MGFAGVGGVILLQLQEKTLQEVKIDSAGLLQIAFAFGLGKQTSLIFSTIL